MNEVSFHLVDLRDSYRTALTVNTASTGCPRRGPRGHWKIDALHSHNQDIWVAFVDVGLPASASRRLPIASLGRQARAENQVS